MTLALRGGLATEDNQTTGRFMGQTFALETAASPPDTALRSDQCRGNILHVVPSRKMKTDAAAQFPIWKKWPKSALVHGSHPEDRAMSDSYRGTDWMQEPCRSSERKTIGFGGCRSQAIARRSILIP